MDWLSSNSMFLTEKNLDYLWQRQQMTLQNIANVDTPGYKGKYATFEEELARSLSGLESRQEPGSAQQIRKKIGEAKVWIHESKEESARLDGNNVQIDAEQLELTRAQLQYEFALRQVTEEFNRLRTVITGS